MGGNKFFRWLPKTIRGENDELNTESTINKRSTIDNEEELTGDERTRNNNRPEKDPLEGKHSRSSYSKDKFIKKKQDIINDLLSNFGREDLTNVVGNARYQKKDIPDVIKKTLQNDSLPLKRNIPSCDRTDVCSNVTRYEIRGLKSRSNFRVVKMKNQKDETEESGPISHKYDSSGPKLERKHNVIQDPDSSKRKSGITDSKLRSERNNANKYNLIGSCRSLSDTNVKILHYDVDQITKKKENSNAELAMKEYFKENSALTVGRKKEDVINVTKYGLHDNMDDTNLNILRHDLILNRWPDRPFTEEEEQVLISCPTCGRKFSESAAFRHFPICSKVEKKRIAAICKTAATHRDGSYKGMFRNRSNTSCCRQVVGLSDDNNKQDKIDQSMSKIPVSRLNRAAKQPSRKIEDTHESILSCELKNCRSNLAIKNRETTSSIIRGNRFGNTSARCTTEKARQKRTLSKRECVQKCTSIWKKSYKEGSTCTSKIKLALGENLKTVQKREMDSEGCSSGANSKNSEFHIINDFKPHSSYCRRTTSIIDKKSNYASGSVSDKISVDVSPDSSKPNKPWNQVALRNSKSKYTNIIPHTIKRLAGETHAARQCIIAQKHCTQEASGDKLEFCSTCGKRDYGKAFEAHTHLCERVKKIEEIIVKRASNLSNSVHTIECSCSKEKIRSPDIVLDRNVAHTNDITGPTDHTTGPTDHTTGPTDHITTDQYYLLKHDDVTPQGESCMNIISLKCPCCFQPLDIVKRV